MWLLLPNGELTNLRHIHAITPKADGAWIERKLANAQGLHTIKIRETGTLKEARADVMALAGKIAGDERVIDVAGA